MNIVELWRYPVKSLQGERLDAAQVTAHGLQGDRSYGIVDVDTGYVLTGRREPRLLFASAAWRDGEVVVTGPDGDQLADDAALSAWLERPVTLRAAGAPGTFETQLTLEQ
ncbi:MAG: MOSC N-terminal beta barrel domain-containing protein, partial [Acidimicrobiia bacterium]